MNDQRFSIAEAYSFGYRTFFKHFLFFLGLTLTVFAVTSLVGASIFGILYLPFAGGVMEAVSAGGAQEALRVFGENISTNLGLFAVMSFLALVAFSFLGSFLGLGYTKILLELYDKNYSTIGILFSCSHLVVRNLLASILYGLLCLVGFLFFIIPGIYFVLTYGFYHQFIVDKEVGVFEAFSKSAEITRGAKFEIFITKVLIFVIFFIIAISWGPIFALFGNIPWVNVLVRILSNTLSIFTGLFVALVNVYIYRKLLSARV